MAVALILSATPAIAQDAPSAEQGAGEGLAEIVVTAEKRPSVAQKTAISISVVDSETLAKAGVANLADLASVAPSVSFAQNNVATIVSVRGISSRDATESGDPAVSVSIDGFNLQRAVGLNTAMFDLERVEVLRGPQGTLLGRNATGGALNIITAKPKDEFAAYVGGEVGNYSTFATKGMVNIPVNDWLKLRASFQTRDHDGYRDNAPGSDADDQQARAARLHLLIEPTSRLKILLTGEYAQDHNNGPAVRGIPLEYYTAANVPAGFLVGDVDYSEPPRGNAKSFAMPAGSYLKYKIWSIRGEIDYDLDFATLTYQGGYRHNDFERLGILGGGYGTATQNWSFLQTEKLPSWNHELRLSSNGNGPFKWQFGGFYFQEKNDFTNDFIDFPYSPSLSGKAERLTLFRYPDILARAKAVFGQASYEVLPGLTFELGARYSKDRKSRTAIVTSTSLPTYLSTRCYLTNSCVYSTSITPQKAISSKTTYHAAANYQITPRNMVYAKFDTGYKAGGFSTLGSYDPETIKAYEIGSKNRFFGNTLQVNLSAYLYDYSNQQVGQAVVTSAGVGSLIVNAGSSRYKGVEMDVTWQPTGRDRINAYVGYNHGRYRNFATSVSGQLLRLAQIEGAAIPVLAPNGSVAGYNYQLAGKTPPQSPDWTVNFGYEHDFDVFGGTLTPKFQTHYESKSYFSFYNLGLDKQDGYHRSDAVLTFEPEGKKWQISAFVRNIENKLILANVQSPPNTTFGTYREQYQAPRTYGLSFTHNW
ncbi:TonB-dependent receptor domain-containing protein [Sphingobium sp.]|uniref:TonB-dependent receptor n=1 Tax=Sphingobium sp. TaxID=1912891 RepID=UPI0028BD38F3|nr:TonB-dependent receptor [Sphingobium sp.]